MYTREGGCGFWSLSFRWRFLRLSSPFVTLQDVITSDRRCGETVSWETGWIQTTEAAIQNELMLPPWRVIISWRITNVSASYALLHSLLSALLLFGMASSAGRILYTGTVQILNDTLFSTSLDTVIGTVAKQRAARPMNHGSFPSNGNKFSSSEKVKTGSGGHPCSYGSPFALTARPAGCEVQHSCPSAEVKNEWSCTSAYSTCLHGL